MKKVYEFLKKCGTFYLATAEGDQPRVRPFGAVDLFDDKIYIQTGKVKAVSKQMKKNPKVEICGMLGDDRWIRISAETEEDPRLEAQRHMLDTNPVLKSMYKAGDGNTQVLFLKNATATFYSFGGKPETVKF